MSESHVRQMQAIGMNANKVISDYSMDFQRDFVKLLRTAHGTKPVFLNRFYQEVIADKEHVHMNSTRWSSLTEFAKHLGREGLVRVEENDKGLQISWVDNSPDALRRAEAIRKKERQDKGDEEREQRMILEQIEKAQRDAEDRGLPEVDDPPEAELRREDGEKIKLNLFNKPTQPTAIPPATTEPQTSADEAISGEEKPKSVSPPTGVPTPPPEKVSLKMGLSNKPKNVFAAVSKKNALNGAKPAVKDQPKRPMSEAERIMKEEIERKRARGPQGGPGLNFKRPKLS